MKRLAIGALAVFALAAIAGNAAAVPGNQFGELYLSASETERIEFNSELAGFAQFDLFVFVDVDFADDGRGEQNLTNGIKGWEAEFTVPVGVTVLGRELRPASSINVGNPADNFIVGTGALVVASSMPYAVVKYTMGLFVAVPPTDLVMTMGPSTPNSENTEGPNWLEFTDGSIHEFSNSWMDNAFVINCLEHEYCSGMPVRDESFGRVKARF